jgi:glycosyltransferase involved in cell wall biosynthesis
VIISLYKKENQLLQNVDHIICLAKFTQNLLIEEYGISKEKISLINNGLKDEAVRLSEEEKNQLKKQLYFHEKEKLILFVGRLDEIKGLDFLIQSFKQVIKKEPDCHLVVIGDGDYSTYLKENKVVGKKSRLPDTWKKKNSINFIKLRMLEFCLHFMNSAAM